MEHQDDVGDDELQASVREAFAPLGVKCSAHVRSITTNREAGVAADEPFVAASVFKVSVALEFLRQVSAGELSPTERVHTTPASRTPGPTGLSLFWDDAVVSLRDLVTSMMAVSDNAATDIIIARVRIERINRTLRSLGATNTSVAHDMGSLLSTLAEEAGLAAWEDVLREDPNYTRLQTSTALAPETTNRITARDMTTLLTSVWTNSAGPADACGGLRRVMGLQPSRRIGGGLRGARVSVKSGTFLGIVRNEVGVAEFQDGEQFALAVLTHASRTDFEIGPRVDATIGRVSRLLIERARQQ